MNRNKRFVLAAAVAGATALTSLSAEAFFGPFNFMRSWGGGGPWGGYGWYPYYGGWGYPYGGWGYPLWGVNPYLGYPSVAAPAAPTAPAAPSSSSAK